MQLRRLTLSRNLLTGLPPSIGDLTSLQTLEVTANQLTSLPLTIGGLVSLQSLGLRYNVLCELPYTLGKLQALKELDVGSNKLSSLPTELGLLPALSTIDYDPNPFESGIAPTLASVEHSPNKVKTLLDIFRRVYEDGTSATCTTAIGAVLEPFIVGDTKTLIIQARDALRNQRHSGGDLFTAVFTCGRIYKLPVRDEKDGTYSVRVSPALAGIHSLAIQFEGAHIEGSPFSICALPDSTFPEMCSIEDVSHTVIAGVPQVWTLHLRDRFRNMRGRTSDLIRIESICGGTVETRQIQQVTETGIVSIDMDLRRAGCHSISVTIDGQHVSGSPVSLKVVPAQVSPAHCTAVGGGLHACVVNRVTTFSIEPRDAFGNLVPRSGLAFDVKVSVAAATVSITETGDGEYECLLLVSVPGMFQITVTLNGEHIQGSPFRGNAIQPLVDKPKVPYVPLQLEPKVHHVCFLFLQSTGEKEGEKRQEREER